MTKASKGRINARVDSELERKLSYLRQRTKKSTTAILREAIDRYHAALEKTVVETPVAILERIGFVGCANGPRDLSLRYKDAFARSLREKL